jgi:hypothetical protein
MTDYHVIGWRRDDSEAIVHVLVESTGEIPHRIAERIAGPDYYFVSSENLFFSVPDHVKNRLFTSDKELYAAVPEMNPRRRRAVRR